MKAEKVEKLEDQVTYVLKLYAQEKQDGLMQRQRAEEAEIHRVRLNLTYEWEEQTKLHGSRAMKFVDNSLFLNTRFFCQSLHCVLGTALQYF